MHFIIGGAYQGKRNYVLSLYEFPEWVSSYEGKNIDDVDIISKTIIFEGLEQFIKELLQKDIDCLVYLQEFLKKWKQWEESSVDHKIVLIGCDIHQGIVPVDPFERKWRDITGFCYQEIVRNSDKVDRVWCGIAERIKGEEK